jgi:hypothetical protein
VLGEFSRVDETGQLDLIARRCDLNPESVARAFNVEEFNESSLIQTVRLLKHIEQTL